MESIKSDAPARSKRKNEGFGTTKCGSLGDGFGSLGLGYCHLPVILLKQKLQQGNDYVSY
ncbi:MAG: hypothetical protein ACJ0DI_05365 [bacterium]